MRRKRERGGKGSKDRRPLSLPIKTRDLSKMFAPRGTQCYGIYASPWDLADQGCLLIV